MLAWMIAWAVCYRADPKPTGDFALVNGKKIRYSEEGQGPVLLLIHGSAGSIEDWEPTRTMLLKGHRVIAVDRPGQGHSDAVEADNQLAAQADILAEWLKQRTSDRAVLVGHSYGGGVALAMAVRHPAHVRGVVHVAGVGSPERAKRNKQAWSPLFRIPWLRGIIAQLAGRILARRVIRQGLEDAFDPERSFLTEAFVERNFALWSQPRIQIARTLEIDRLYHDLAEIAPLWPSIKAPVYLLAAGGDRSVSPDTARELFRQIPYASIQILPNASHMLPVTQPKAIAAAVSRVEEDIRLASPPIEKELGQKPPAPF